ncbi:MAG: hypothetical protein LBI90_02060 [Treponema sp.]|jgi:hypothetical protein|nr:hypothetical protein [Treponema sp.]
MPKKSKQKSNKKSNAWKNPKNRIGGFDILVAFLCLAGAALFLHAFRQDLNRTLSRFNETPVGFVTFKHRTAERRFTDRLIWNRLRRESPVYNGDYIRTAELSEAVITIGGADPLGGQGGRLAGAGTMLSLSENSLIRILVSSPRDGGAPSVELSGGAVSVSVRGESLTLSSGKSVIVVKEGGVVSAGAGGGGLVLIVNEGNAVLSDGEGSRRADAGEILFSGGETANGASTDGGGRGEARVRRVTALLPRPNARFLRGTPVRFLWNPVNYGPEDTTLLEIAGDRDFTRIFYSLDTAETEAPAEIPPGSWWWRLIPAGDAGSAETGKFTVLDAPPPGMITPQEGEVFPYRAEETALRFRWTEQEAAVYYLLEAADNPALNNPALKVRTENSWTVLSGLGPGRWYWRLTPVFPPDYAGSPLPASGSFAVERMAAADTSARHGEDAVPPAAANTANAAAVNAAGTNAGERRTIFPPDNYTAAESLLPDIRFTWKTGAPGPVRFQVSPDPDFSRLTVNTAAGTEAFQGLTLPPGDYYWRIEAGDLHTPASRFSVVPSLPPPPGETPGMVLVRPGVPLSFTWRPVEEAAYYRLKLYAGTETSEKPVYESAYIPGTALSLPADAFEEGTYTQTLQAFSPESAANSRRTGLLGVSRFVLRRLRPVSLDYPAAGRNYAGLDAFRRPDTVRWSSAETVTESRFVLSRNASLTDTLMTVDDPPLSIRLPPLPAGNYYWIIQAKTSGGFDISAAGPVRFRVLPVPILPAPGNLRPPEGFALGPAELRNSRIISFGWDAVQGANAYIFTLYLEADGEKRRIFETDTVGTEYVLEDLSLLSAGKFVWQVSAVNRGDDLEQTGKAGESHFTVELPAIPRERPLETGILYGR